MLKFQVGFSDGKARIVTKNALEERMDELFQGLKNNEQLLVLVEATETTVFLVTSEKTFIRKEKFQNIGFKTGSSKHLSEVLRELFNSSSTKRIDKYDHVFRAIAGDATSYRKAAEAIVDDLNNEIKKHSAKANNLSEMIRLEEERDKAKENLSNIESGNVEFFMCYLTA